MHELRRHPRIEFDRRVWCEHPTLTLYLPLANVSAGGMFLQTSAGFHVGDTVRVSLELEDSVDTRVVADVEIRWAGKTGRMPGFGCRVLRFLRGRKCLHALRRSPGRARVVPNHCYTGRVARCSWHAAIEARVTARANVE